MRAAAFVLLAVSGCDAWYGITDTRLIDAHVIIIETDAGPTVDAPALIPPDGATMCTPSPDYSTWTWEGRPGPFPGSQVGSFGMFERGGEARMFATPVSGIYIWDYNLDTNTATEIETLRPPSGRTISSVSSSPDGEAVWFRMQPVNYVAFRSRGFVRQETDLGLPDANEVLPASVGYYNGSLRMIARVRDTTQTAYVELQSLDGETWTRGATLPFGGAGYFNANLSADGCTLVFAQMGSSSFSLYRSDRATDGTFGTPVLFTTMSVSTNSINPALAPSGNRIVASSFAPVMRLIEATP